MKSKKKHQTIEEEIVMPGASSVDELLGSSQETVTDEGSSVGASCGTKTL